MRAIFAVTVIDRSTGAERVIRVEAANKEQARHRVLAMGEMVGGAELIEVLEDSPAPSAGATPTSSAPPGAIANTCPKCTGTEWTGGRGCLLWGLVILLFPLGLLLLFVQPTWKCASCGYTYRSYSTPAGYQPERSVGYQVLRGIVIAIAIIGIGVLALAVLAQIGTP